MAFQFRNVVISGTTFNVHQGSQGKAFPDFDLRAIILHRLRPPNYIDYFPIHRSARIQNTCEWATQNNSIQTWLFTEESHLWLYGKPGTGKSVLAAFMVEYIQQLHGNIPGHLVLSYFCKSEGQKNKAVHVLMGFVRQIFLLSYIPELEDIARNFAERIMGEREEYMFTLAEMEQYLASFLRVFPKIWIIVDGVDECEDAVALITVLDRIDSAYGVKLLLISRKEVDIENCLIVWPQLEVGGEKTTDDDLQQFINAEVDALVSDIPLLRDQGDRLKESLATSAGNMFLYARLKCQTIRETDPSTEAHVSQILNSLDSSPSDLDGLYEAYLSQRLSRNNKYRNEIALRVLQWIRWSPAPLSSLFLQRALAVDLAKDEGVSADYIDGDIKKTIAKALGVLIDFHIHDEFYGADVYYASLMHHSFRDYLSRLSSNPIQWEELMCPFNSIFRETSHAALLAVCCIIISTGRIWGALQGYHDSADWRRQLYPTRREKLIKQICQGRSWQAWEQEQRQELDLHRRWRKEEMNRMKSELLEFSDEAENLAEWIETRNNQLELYRIHSAEPQINKELQTLVTLTTIRERELMVYAFEYTSVHLIGAGQQSNALLVNAINKLISQINIFAFNILMNINFNQAEGCPLRLASIRDLLIALNSLSRNLKLIQLILELGPASLQNSLIWSCFNSRIIYQILFLSPTFLPFNRVSEPAWNFDIFQSIKMHKISYSAKLLFALATLAIRNTRDVEIILCNYDDHMLAVVGVGVLLHSLRQLNHIFAQWTAFHNFSYLGESQRLLAEDHFIFPVLLTSLTSRPNTEVHADGVLVFDSKSINYPIYFILSVLLALIVGFWTTHPLYLAFICVICSGRDVYSFYRHPISLLIFRNLPVCFFAEWVVLQTVSKSRLYIILAAIVSALYATRLVSYRFYMIDGSVRFAMQINNGPLRKALGPVIDWAHNDIYLIAVIFRSDISFFTYTIFYIALLEILEKASDPIGLQRAQLSFQNIDP